MDDVRYRLHLSLPSLSLFLYSLTARLFNPYAWAHDKISLHFDLLLFHCSVTFPELTTLGICRFLR